MIDFLHLFLLSIILLDLSLILRSETVYLTSSLRNGLDVAIHSLS